MFEGEDYTNECYECGHEWFSSLDDDPCPECGAIENIGTEVNNG